MKYKRVFIASSAEMKQERMELVDLLHDLNDEVDNQGLKFKPVLWEYLDSSMGINRKEDEYLEKLRECKICLVLFWRTLGEYTVEELDVAMAEMQAGRLPKQIYVLYKEPCDGISNELMEFKKSFSMKYPHIPVQPFKNQKMLRELVTSFISPQLHLLLKNSNQE